MADGNVGEIFFYESLTFSNNFTYARYLCRRFLPSESRNRKNKSKD